MSLRPDDAGLESLPLRLMIVAVVAGLSIAPAADALEALEDRSFLHRCDVELLRLISASQAVAMEGVGSNRTLGIDLATEGRLHVDRVAIGDAWGDPYMTSVVLDMSSGRRVIRSASEPFVWLASGDLDQLLVSSDRFWMLMACDVRDGRHVVVCEVAPWTS